MKVPPWRDMALRLRVDYKGYENPYLAGVLRTIRTREATDDKDRSYATYGVLQRLGVKNLSQPEYSKPLGQVYQELIRDLLQWNSVAISLLLDAGAHSNIEAPSWVPGWSIAPKKQWIRSEYIIEPVINPTSEVWLEFRGNDGLVVKGARIDTVEFSSRGFRKISNFGIILPNPAEVGSATLVFIRWLRFLDRDTPVHPAYQDPAGTAAKILDAAIDSKAELHLLDREEFHDWYRLLTTSKACLQEPINIETDSDTGQFEDNIIEQTYGGYTGNYSTKELTVAICNHLAGRRNIFATTSGLVGSGPEAMSSGDIVAQILGIPIPIVLREVPYSDDKGSCLAYRVIGPAFVYEETEDDRKEYSENIILI
ncbi:hypothetical protein F5B19DRAFT_240165 [Rostrohypoxylon terebratum]|nr:hypothetical protein F5B19DRAFT_240165 [Rostrohypoxylon terebratum]